MNETIRENKEVFQKRIKETIENYDLSNDISEQISNEFGQMADTIYKLSELFKKIMNPMLK
jgi:methyl-accepting chemotaxis protein